MINYTKKDLDELIQKEVEIQLGDEDEVFAFKGKIISYNTDSNDAEVLSDFCFHTVHGAIKTFSFNNLKDIKVLDH